MNTELPKILVGFSFYDSFGVPEPNKCHIVSISSICGDTIIITYRYYRRSMQYWQYVTLEKESFEYQWKIGILVSEKQSPNASDKEECGE